MFVQIGHGWGSIGSVWSGSFQFRHRSDDFRIVYSQLIMPKLGENSQNSSLGKSVWIVLVPYFFVCDKNFEKLFPIFVHFFFVFS